MDIRQAVIKIVNVLEQEKKNRLTPIYGFIELYLEGKRAEKYLKDLKSRLSKIKGDFLELGHQFDLHEEFEFLFQNYPQELDILKKKLFKDANKQLYLVTQEFNDKYLEGEINPEILMGLYETEIKKKFDTIFLELENKINNLFLKEEREAA